MSNSLSEIRSFVSTIPNYSRKEFYLLTSRTFVSLSAVI
jgi:hypothetical protein